jgi:hypothetical protein
LANFCQRNDHCRYAISRLGSAGVCGEGKREPPTSAEGHQTTGGCSIQGDARAKAERLVVAWCAAVAVALLAVGHLQAQEAPANPSATPKPAAEVPWKISITVDGYLVPDGDSYVNPNVAADHGWLHLEARYNYENLRTGSVWFGYNFSAGKKLVLNVTPMIGGVFGQTGGIAPGCEASLSYKRVTLSISNEYVFDLNDNARSFYYSWPEVTYSLTDWLRVGAVAQRTKAFQTKLDTQRGFLVGFSHKHAEFTTYVFDPGSDLSAVFEVGWSF